MKHRFRATFLAIALVVSTAFGMLAISPSASALDCAILPSDVCNAADQKGTDVKSSGIFLFLKWILNILTAVVGLAAVGAIVYAGIMYSSAGDDSGMVSKAKTIIRDTIIGIVAYGLMVVGLNWIIPGGVLG